MVLTRSPLAAALTNALYLGVSWTWCIGMYLPVLLVRDYGGWAAFLAFAIPNVLGAAAMGFVLREPSVSREMVRRHSGAMVSFSRVTIAYQAFFAGWMLPGLLGWWTGLIYPLLLVALIFVIRRDQMFTRTTLLTFLVSVGAGTALGVTGHLSVPPMGSTAAAGALAPACLLGFLLCPYLDLTFHHAFERAHQSGGYYGGTSTARLSFLMGFGVFFASMIVLTLLYSQVLPHRDSPLANTLVGVHMLCQLVVTILLHEHRAATVARREKSYLMPFLTGFFALGLVCFFLPAIGRLAAGEWVYRTFLAYYALLAPVYVLLRIVTPTDWRLTGAAALTALPFYALGFFTPNPSWMLAGSAVVLAAWGLSVARGVGRRSVII